MASMEIRHDGPVTWLTLNRPGQANAIDLALARELRDAVGGAEGAEPRAVVIDARGSVFCAGGDVAAMTAAESPSAYVDELAGVLHDAFDRMTRSRGVVIAAVGGAAAGAGLGLVLNADIVLATARARFLTAYPSVGFSPDSGVSYLLPRTVGTHRALDMAITGRVLDAETAQSWGIVSEIVADDQLLERAGALAHRLGAAGGEFLGQTKRLVREAGTRGYVDHLADERATVVSMASQPVAARLLREFTERGSARGPRD